MAQLLSTDLLLVNRGDVTYTMTFAELEASVFETLNQCLPQSWSHSNPIDIVGDAGNAEVVESICTHVHAFKSWTAVGGKPS